MATPYPDKDFTEHERFAEQEARFLEQLIEGDLKNISTYMEKLISTMRITPGVRSVHTDYLHFITTPMDEAAWRINTRAQMADNLRRPRITRIERERYGR